VRRIAFFGGAFDPPHRGHEAAAQQALALKLSDRVLWTPSWRPPHKTVAGMAGYADRLAMAALAARAIPGCAASDIEGRKRFDPSYSIRVLAALEEENPGCRVQLLIGADSLEELHTWYCAKELVERYEIITYPRRLHGKPDVAPRLPEAFWGAETAGKLRRTVMAGTFVEISSTELRATLADGGGGLVNAAVWEYIKQHGLYGVKPGPEGE